MAGKRRKRRNGEGCVIFRRDRGTWYCVFKGADGRRHKQSARELARKHKLRIVDPTMLDSKSAGEKIAKQVLAAVLAFEGDMARSHVKEVSVAEIREQHLAYQRARNSACHVRRVRGALSQIINALGAIELTDITHAKVEYYIEERLNDTVPNNPSRTIAPRTVNIEVTALKTMLKWAEMRGMIASNPIAKVRPLTVTGADKVKVRRALTLDEIDRLFKFSPPRQRLIWQVFLGTGLRRGELSSLEWDDLDLVTGVLRVRAEVAKNGSERVIPLNPDLRDLLVAHREEVERRADEQGRERPALVFTNAAGTSMYSTLLRNLYACLKKAEINPEGVDVHSLRATWISYEIDSGRNPKHVQYMAGHKTFSMTMDTYYKIRPDALLRSQSNLPYFQPRAAQPDENDGRVVPRVVPHGDMAAG